jgi:pyruvate,water dikinase
MPQNPSIVPLREATDPARFGSKSANLARALDADENVPPGVCLGVGLYREFVSATGLDKAIREQIARKPLDETRYEERWDLALRIRNRFRRASFADEVSRTIMARIREELPDGPLAVRSSSPLEDSAELSHAGLFDTIAVDSGAADPDELLRAVRLVFASLFSDRALTYRSELGLDPEQSAMAVLIQQHVPGEVSGVLFTASPSDPSTTVVEAVRGGGEPLVAGRADPATYILDAESGSVREAPGDDMLGEWREDILALGRRLESLFGGPQDIEWTIANGQLHLLQSRPVTTLRPERGDEHAWTESDRRPWYMTFHRSLESLARLRDELTQDLLPRMDAAAERLADATEGRIVSRMADVQLASEIEHYRRVRDYWNRLYYERFAPLAQAIRLFGAFYNDILAPDDPFAFVDLLVGGELASVRRNKALSEMAAMVRDDEDLRRDLEAGREPDNEEFNRSLQEFIAEFGELSCIRDWCESGPPGVRRAVLHLADAETAEPSPREAPASVEDFREAPASVEDFREALPEAQRERGMRLLELARDAWRLRDDDNLSLARIDTTLEEVVEEGRRRLRRRGMGHETSRLSAEQVERALRRPGDMAEVIREAQGGESPPEADRREFQGHPAGPGVASGPARIIDSYEDLFALEHGEIMVVDALDPTMTFAAPLAAGIIERRGGMLVHGAIIAREYGLPCVTGISRATRIFQDGEQLVVDGFSGIVRRKNAEQ